MSSPNVKDRVLVRMLNCLDAKQRKGFRAYLECSLFNTNPSLVTLFVALQKKVLDKDKAYVRPEELLSGTGIKPKMLDKLCSQLMAKLERFVPVWFQREDPRQEFGQAFQAWREMGLEQELLERQYRKMKRRMEKMPASEFDLFFQFQLGHQYLQFKSSQPRRDQVAHFQAQRSLLDSFFFVSQLRYLCGSLSAGQVFKEGEASHEFALTLEQAQALPPLGRAYHGVYLQLLSDIPVLDKVEEILENLEKEGEGFSREDRQDLHGYLINICIRGMLRDSGFEGLLNKVYDSLLHHGLLIQNGTIPGSHFKNIVSTKIRVKALEEAREFINLYQDRLPKSERQILVAYTRGLVDFHSQDHRAAIRQFRSIVEGPSEDLFWGLEARNMLWRSYFETYDSLSVDELEEMLRLYDSFRLFVSRNKRISDYHKASYEQFIRIFNRLICVGNQALWASSVEDLEQLKRETEAASPLEQKKWLLVAIQKRIDSQSPLSPP